MQLDRAMLVVMPREGGASSTQTIHLHSLDRLPSQAMTAQCTQSIPQASRLIAHEAAL